MLFWKNMLWYVAVGLYTINLAVGLAAQLRWYHFGLAHHILYFFVFASTLATTWVWFHPVLLLTVAALTYMPMSKPGTWKHPTSACVGFLGYGLAWYLL